MDSDTRQALKTAATETERQHIVIDTNATKIESKEDVETIYLDDDSMYDASVVFKSGRAVEDLRLISEIGQTFRENADKELENVQISTVDVLSDGVWVVFGLVFEEP